MPDDDFDDLDDEDTEQNQPTVNPAELRIARKKAKQYDELQPAHEALKRENLVLRTFGQALDERKTRALFGAHDGELTPEGLRQTAEALGFVAPTAPAVPGDEEEAITRMAQAAAGDTLPPREDIGNAIANARSEAEVMAIVNRYGLGVTES